MNIWMLLICTAVLSTKEYRSIQTRKTAEVSIEKKILNASRSKQWEKVKLLLNHRLGKWERDENGRSAIHYAAFENEPSVIKKLLEYGAEIDAMDNHSFTPLMMAVIRGNTECVRILLRRKANQTLLDKKGRTAFDIATMFEIKNKYSIISIFLEDHGLHQQKGLEELQSFSQLKSQADILQLKF
jgi:ankyrin repeat protein